MRRYLLVLLAFTFFLSSQVWGQDNQVLNNGQTTNAVNFTGGGCIYNWVNDTPGIGLAASGTGDISSFTAVNNGNTAVIANITATPTLAGFAYIANSIPSGAISVVNIATDVVVATIPVGRFPECVAISPNGKLVYVTDFDDNNVLVINTATSAVIATIPIAPGPSYGISVSPDGSLVYVANQGPGTVTVIDAVTNKVISTILIGKFSNPNGLLISPDGNTVYVSNGRDGTVSVINASTNLVISTIVVGSTPWGLALSKDGKVLYAANEGSGNVSVIDVATGMVVSNITVGNSPVGISISPDGSLAYVSNLGDGTVSVINTATGSVTATITVGSSPEGVSFSPEGSEAYVLSNTIDNNVSIINTTNNQVISTLSIGEYHNSFGEFITGNFNCSPVKFTITVNPTNALPPTIVASPATGTISACAGSASASPQIQQFTVSGSNLTGNITATAPAGFEVSLTSGSGYGVSVTIPETGGAAANTLVYVRSASSDPAGPISGNVNLTSTGAGSQTVVVRGAVSALPIVNSPGSQFVTNGAPSTAINFTGTGNTFTWTNDTPGIGLAASGTGNIASFTAVNSGNNPVVATVTATPINAPLAYITNSGSNTVSVINTFTNSIIATINVGQTPQGVCESPDGTRVYVTNSTDGSVSVINTATNSVTTTIMAGTYAYGICVSPDGSRLYVSTGSQVTVINTQTNTVVKRINVGTFSDGIAMSPDGQFVYVACGGVQAVYVISCATNSVVTNITVGSSPLGICLSPDGSRAYVPNAADNTVSVINTTNNSVSTFPVGTEPVSISVSPDGSRIYVANNGDATVSVINTSGNVLVTNIAVGNDPFGTSVTADGSWLYVANDFSNNVSVINTSTNKVTATIAVGIGPLSLGPFITGGSSCSGPPVKFSITVKPTSSPAPTITAGPATGTISACVGTASLSPQIQQFTVSGSNLPGDILAAAPSVFEVSLSPNSGFGNFVTLKSTGGVVNSTVVYVRSAATASAGIKSGYIDLTSGGFAGSPVPVTETINNLPTVNPLGPQVVNNGAPTLPVSFTGPGNTYTWTNDTPGIGLAASGTGDIASFTAINTGSSPVKATITVVPKSLGYAYISNSASNNVSVISLTTNAVVATVAVGRNPSGVAVSPDGSLVFVANSYDNNVSVINTSSNTVVTTIPVGARPNGVVFSPDGSKVYVSNAWDDNVSVISVATNTVINKISAGEGPAGLITNKDGSILYVANAEGNDVYVINTITGYTGSIGTDSFPVTLALSPDESLLYITTLGTVTGSVMVANTANNTIKTTIPLKGAGYAIWLSPDGSTAYVPDGFEVNVINMSTNTLTTTIPVDPSYGVWGSADGSLAYVTNSGFNNVAVINTATNAIVTNIPVGTTPKPFGNFVASGTGCQGIPVQFTITVNPTSATSPTITATTASGYISACAGTASASPEIEQFTVSGSGLTGNITATASPLFEVSLSAGSGYGNSLIIPETGGTAANTVVYIRSIAAAPTGAISGSVNLTSGTTTETVFLTATVYALPKINTVANESVTNGTPTTAINFTGTGNTFTWTNDTPGIGLAAGGTGNIASFTAVNTGTTPVVATITATPAIAGYLYVPYGATSVAVINNITYQVLSTITVGQSPGGISVSPDGTRVYVANINDNTVSVINTSTNTITATINVGTRPLGISVSPDGSQLYVANFVDGTVSVINTTTNSVSATVTVGQSPSGVAVSADGSKVYITNAGSGTVSVINTVTNAVVAAIAVGSSPTGIALSPDGSRAYVANDNSGNLSVINTTNNAVIATIATGNEPWGVLVSHDGSTVYVSNHVSNTVSVISTSSNAVTSTITVGLQPGGISISADDTRVYVANVADGTVSVIETAANSMIASIPVGAFPQPFGNFVMSGPGCPGASIQFTITVKPTSSAVPSITASTATGIISACAGTASLSPQLQQFTVSGSNLAGNITATAPAGFEVSLSAANGYGPNVMLTQTGGTVNSTTIYVRSSATAATGNITGSVVLTSTTATQDVAVTGTVNAIPTVNNPGNQSTTNGAATTAVNFTGTGNTFTWTNDTPGIGLAASGTGNIASFTAVNTGSSPINATITVEPSSKGYAYFPDPYLNSVAVINTQTNTVVGAIQVGGGPAGIAVNPAGTRVYVTNAESSNVSVIDVATNTVMTTIPVGSYPYCVAVSPDGNAAYVTNQQSQTVSVINTATNVVTSTINVGSSPWGITVSQDGTRLYLTNYLANTVSVVNLSTKNVTTIAIGANPIGIAISPDGNYVYAANFGSNTISVISTISNTVVATVPTGAAPMGVSVTPDGQQIYISNSGSTTVSVIAAATNKITATINVGNNPEGISVSPTGDAVYVSNTNGNSVSVINTTTNTVTLTVPASTGQYDIGNFVTGGSNCTGPPTQFTITVKPTAATSPAITATAATGNNTTCQGTASASPNIQQVLISASNLTGPVSLAAPNGFEISLSATTGFGNSLTVTPVGGNLISIPVYARLAATAAVGSNSGKIACTSPGATTIEIPVAGTVNALPTVTQLSNLSVTNGQTTAAIDFSGTANTFSWINDTPGIGLPASGTGNIASFVAVNTGSSPVKANITVTPMPSEFAYITDEGSNSVSVISTATNSIVSNIPVGGYPIGVAVSPDGTRAYVVNRGAVTLSVINTATNAVITPVPTGANPIGVAVSPDGSRVYVTNQDDGTISVINTSTNTVTATVSVGQNPYGIVVSPDGSKVYVSNNNGNGTVSVVNALSNMLIATIPVGVAPGGIVVSADGSKAYVENFVSNTVSVINTATNAVMADIPVGSNPWGIALGPDGSRLYVSNQNSNNVFVINTADNSVVTIIPVGVNPYGVCVSADGSSVYVANINSNTVSVISTATNLVTATIPVAGSPAAFGNFITPGTNCTGTPMQFTITVNPTLTQAGGIVVSQVTGGITTCQGTASTSPNIGQFTVSGTSLTAPIVLTAPNNFEISLSPGGGFATTITLSLTGTSVNNTIIYVRASATSSAGIISDKVSINSTGVQSQTVPVTGTVNALPTVSAIAPQSFLNGAITTAINISGTGNTYNWTNNTPGIGLPASGTGSIPAFTAVNTSGAPITATITVTPSSSGFAYINNYGSNTVSVINTGNNIVVKNIPVQKSPWGVAINPDGSKIYVTNQGSNTVSVIDAATNAVISTINVGLMPEGVVISPDGSTLYVANDEGTTVSVISTVTNLVTSAITVGSNPQGLAISPDGTKLYVANATSNTVSVVTTLNNTVVSTITVGAHPFELVVSPDGANVYVTNFGASSVSVINTSNNTVSATAPVGANPDAVCVSPDGSFVYVSDSNAGTIAVINTATRAVTYLNVSATPDGLALSDNGNLLYVNNFGSGSVSVIDTSTGNVVATIGVGQFPDSIGNFIWQGTGCPGVPATFTITIEPTLSTSPTIAANAVTGSISACAGMASASPQIEQFTVTGSKLTGDITAAAPLGFEVSLSAGSGFGNTVTITQSGGNVNNTVVYVRSAATASPGPISGNVVLSSPGATSQDVAVNGVVNYLPTVNAVTGEVTANGLTTTPISFTGSGDVFTWTNDTPSIGLPASGSGNIASFVAVNPGAGIVIATIVVTPGNSITGCTGAPQTFTITVGPTPPTAVTATGTLSALTTPYGTPSPSETFSVSGTSLTSGILITPPAGFEISTNNVDFSSTLTVGGGGNVAAQTIYIRLAAITPVGPYSGNIKVTSPGAAEADLFMPVSTVTPALLAIIADDKSKTFGTVNPTLTATYVGFVNFETVANLTTPPLLATAATTYSAVGQYPITVGGASALNYTISYIDGTLTIAPTEQSIVIPNTFTPNGDGINDTWDIKFLDLYVNCTVDIFTRWGQKIYTSIGYGTPWDGTFKGSALPTGTYYYVINLKNGLTPLSGFVAIIR